MKNLLLHTTFPNKSCVWKYLLLYLFFSASALLQAQEYMSTRVTVSAQNEELSKVLEKLAQAANVRFFYDHTEINARRKISVNAKSEPLGIVLSQLFSGQDVSIEYQSRRVVVLKPSTPDTRPKEAVDRVVSGKVMDAVTKELLIGVTIVWQNDKSKGVATDANGDFTLKVPSEVSALEISYIGYETQTLKLANAPMTNLVIQMQHAAIELEDAVITGIRKRSTESFTGDYVRVEGDKLVAMNPTNVLTALQHFDSSFRVVENNSRGSDPNALPEFRMRGDVQLESVTSDDMTLMIDGYANLPNMPLFVLDGFQVSIQRIINLEPERIKEVIILKDAAATAIYGSKAANGVIVFETKAPLPGKINFAYSTNVGVSIPDLTDYNLMNSEQKLEAEVKAGFYNEQSASQMNIYNHYKGEVLRGVNTYWLSQPLRTAVTQRHSLSAEGGDDALRYRLGVNYATVPGLMKKSDRSNAGMDFNLNYRVGKLNLSNHISINNTLSHNTPYGSFSAYTLVNPYYRIHDENGNYKNSLDEKFTGVGVASTTIYNPLYNAQFPSKNFSESFVITNNLSVEYRILENFRLSGNLSFMRNSSKSENFVSPNNTIFLALRDSDLALRGTYAKTVGNSTSWTGNLSADYNMARGNHLLSLFGRWDISSMSGDAFSLRARGFPNDQMSDFLFGFEMQDRPSGSDTQSRSIGLITQAGYMYAQRYSIDLSLRTDMSSSFGSDNRLAPFWSVGTRWNIDKEPWFTFPWASSLVLRASYGVTGSQNYSPYQAIRSYSYSEYMYPYLSSDVIGAVLMAIGNSKLGWSTTKNTNLGFQYVSPRNLVSLSYSFYNNYTDQLLLDFTLAPSAGFSSMMENAGAILNRGHQFDVSVTPYQNMKERVQWIVSFNASTNSNRIDKISNVLEKQNQANLENKNAPKPVYVEGESTSRIFLVRSLGIDPATGQELFLDKEGNKTFIWNAKDKMPVGDSNPKLQGSINSSFNYKNFNVSFGFRYSLGSDVYNNTLVDKIENANLAYNADIRALTERWSPDNRGALYKGMVINGSPTSGNLTNASTRFLQRLNELQFSSIALSYRMEPKTHKILNTLNIRSLSFSGNLLDIGRISTVKRERGLDYPFARAFTLSMSVIFK